MTYTPKPGSVADQVVSMLRAPGAPDRLYQLDLQRRFEKPAAANIAMCLERAIDYGVIERGKCRGRVYYALPEHDAASVARVMNWTVQQVLQVAA